MADDLPAGSRVVVAMSGGVDSSVAAALMAGAGHEVIGVTLQLYDHGAAIGRAGACCAGRDIHDARRVADQLGIAHYVIDAQARFRAAVIDDFVDSYAAGRTPVPCVRCNQSVKFQDLLQIARDLGAAALVTGHYARRLEGRDGPELWRASDAAKDQSYFLFATTPAQLDFLRFPLGDRVKPEIRRLAADLGLAVAAKPESQDICFVPTGHYTALVARLRPEAMTGGDIVHVDGRLLGRHDGAARFTVGQRRGLGVAAAEPLYVAAVDAGRHRVIVGPHRSLAVTACTLSDTHWLTEPGDGGLMVKHRYNAPAVAARLDADRVMFTEPQAGVAPGQVCVAYRGDRLVGGGWIAATEPAVALDRVEVAA